MAQTAFKWELKLGRTIVHELNFSLNELCKEMTHGHPWQTIFFCLWVKRFKETKLYGESGKIKSSSEKTKLASVFINLPRIPVWSPDFFSVLSPASSLLTLLFHCDCHNISIPSLSWQWPSFAHFFHSPFTVLQGRTNGKQDLYSKSLY